MRIGISLPLSHPSGRALTGQEVASYAKEVEDYGFDGIWLSDVVGRGITARPDALMFLSIAATVTERVELGTAVFQVPVRARVDLAQRLSTLYGLSNGRFSAGLGAGSSANDFVSAGMDFDKRFKVLAENLDVMRRLLAGEIVDGASLPPWTNTAGKPDILVGAWASSIWIRKAAREFDGWLTSGGGPGGNTFRNLREGIKEFRDLGGKRAIVATVPCNLNEEGESLTDESRFSLRCPPEEARARVALIEELGYDDILIRNDALTMEEIHQISEELHLKRA